MILKLLNDVIGGMLIFIQLHEQAFLISKNQSLQRSIKFRTLILLHES